MPYPRIPDEISEAVDLRRMTCAAALRRAEWKRAALLLKETYEFVLEQQEHYQERWHKGWELHNGGIAFLRIGESTEGIDRIALAYVEDALSAPKGEEDRIDDEPAGRALRSGGMSEDFLGKMKELARQRKPDNIPRNPNDLLERALREVSPISQTEGRIVAVQQPWAEQEKRKAERQSIEEIPLPYERRCFIAGSYYHGSNIDEIVRIVRREGFHPIVADEFRVGPRGVHHHSLLLLHLCPKAVFEVTQAAGHLMELERCRDYDIVPLLVRNTHGDQSADVSEMISSMASVDVHPYSLIKKLRSLIADYLHERGDWAPKS